MADNIEAEKKPVLDAYGRSYATGKRKDAIARVWLKRGSGKIIINDKTYSHYFLRPVLQMVVRQPFDATRSEGNFDVWATVSGGGLSGQAGAIKHGISRAIANYDPKSYHSQLKKEGFLTRDPREVERKKPGKPKARKSFQFSKR